MGEEKGKIVEVILLIEAGNGFAGSIHGRVERHERLEELEGAREKLNGEGAARAGNLEDKYNNGDGLTEAAKGDHKGIDDE